MSIVGAFAGFRQLVSMNAAPYFLGIGLVAGLAGFGAGAGVAWKMRSGDVAEAKLEAANVRAEIAGATVGGWMRANQQAAQGRAQFDSWAVRMEHALATGFARVEDQVIANNATMRENIADAKYACLTAYPYPAGSLLLLQRPGGFVAPASADGADSSPAASSSDMPPAAGGDPPAK